MRKQTVLCLGALWLLQISPFQPEFELRADVREHARLHPVDPAHVKWTRGFWADRFRICRDAMVGALEKALHNPENGAYLGNFAARIDGRAHRARHWSDGDCYKWIEALARLYTVTRDEELDRKMDHWIELIGKTQDPDGYISTNIQLDPKKKRWQNLHLHELYNFGHLLTAASVHHRATGKKNFLNIARKAGDYLHKMFQPRPRRLARFGFNPSNIMGAVDLYRATGDRKYLELAGTFVDMRGSMPATPEEMAKPHHLGGTDCTQDRVPLRKETEAVGHCVCAMYLYCGAADVCAETGEKALLKALERIWQNVATRRMYLTGAVGSSRTGRSTRGDPVHESFGRDYELPSRTAYCETCSNIANGMWNWRMLSLTGDARYADLLETVIYNSLTSPVDTGGTAFFYCNPLKRDGRRDGLHRHHAATREPVLSCFCCPPQVARNMAKLNGWIYSLSRDAVWIHIYGGSVLETKFQGQDLKLSQETDYPWDGKIKITLEKAPGTEFTVQVRIPGWADGARLRVKGVEVSAPVKPGTYFPVRRKWSADDVIELDLPLPVRLIEAHPEVKNLRNMAAIRRGPIVYCAEFPLKEDGARIWREGVFLPENIRFQQQMEKNLLGGVVTLRGQALTFQGRNRFLRQIAGAPAPTALEPSDWNDRLYQPLKPRRLKEPDGGIVEITLIPYFAWANRGESLMEVWIPLAR